MVEFEQAWKVLAGLGLFLFGMSQLEYGLKRLAGSKFRQFLKESTDKPVRSVFSGIVATTFVQSSSLVGLVVLAFVGAKIIPLSNAIGIIIGSNLGTTFTGWVVATFGFKFDAGLMVLPFIAASGIGYGLFRGRFKAACLSLLGFSLILMGLSFMKDGANAMTASLSLEQIADYPLIVFLIAGAIFTAIIQSSSASMMLTLSALNAGIIDLPAAAALVIGADFGTTSTVFLGSLQGATVKRRLAMAHIIFNFTVDITAFLMLTPILAFISWLSLTDPLYALVAFHSLFNLFGVMIFVPFIRRFAGFLEKLFPDSEQTTCHYIHHVSTEIPEAAIAALNKELEQLTGRVIYLNLRFLMASKEQLDQLPFEDLALVDGVSSTEQAYQNIKATEGEIANYALQVDCSKELDESKNERMKKQFESVMSASRSAVFAAKSIKDIEQDIISFQQSSQEKPIQSFLELQRQAIEISLQLGLLLVAENPQDKLQQQQSVALLLETLKQQTMQLMSNPTNREGLSSVELSTLLNMSKEVETSANAILESLQQA